MNITEAKLLTDLFLPLHCDFLNIVFILITTVFNNGYLPITVGIVLLFFPKHRNMGLRILIALLLGLIIGNLILKPLIARIRPFEYMDISLMIPKPKDFSFPSGHTQAAFAFASSIYISNKKTGIFMYVVAVLVALSRMYLMVHYPTDVLCGIVLGISYGYISNIILKKSKKQ